MLFIESHCGNKKITISGGEPLEQANSLEILIHRLKGKGYNVCVYTGWEIERVPENILRLVDYIKTGSFEESGYSVCGFFESAYVFY